MDRQACNNSAAYLFLPQVGSILTNYGFGAGRHPPREPRGYIPPERIFVHHVSVKRKTNSGWRTDSLRARPIRSQTEWILNSLHTDNQNKIGSAGITEVSLNSPNEDINSSAVQLEASENIEIDQQNLLYASTEVSLNNSY